MGKPGRYVYGPGCRTPKKDLTANPSQNKEQKSGLYGVGNIGNPLAK